MSDTYDAIVIGSGAGGGIVACVLAEAGQRVLLLERGRSLGFDDVPRDHLRNHRFGKYGHNTGPELVGHPRVAVDAKGVEHVVPPNDGAYHNNAMAVGGGTLVYGAQAWRFLPTDFRMASTYGTPAGSSLADWPINYDELAPHYERAEQEIGVAGDHALASASWKRDKPYPLPPTPDRPSTLALRRAAKSLDWPTVATPLLINTTPYNGRAACVRCGMCVGFACPSDGKNGSQNTVIPRALATGNCKLISNAQAERIDTDDHGKVVGVSFVIEQNGKIERRSVRAKRVVVSAGAIESARLLLNSATKIHPTGLGNESDFVGRNLQGHVYVGAQGLLPETVYDPRGPGVTIGTVKFSHNNAGVIGGGLLADEFIKLPIIFWNSSFPPGKKRWGLEAKHFMRDAYKRNLHIQGPVQEIPNPEARVQVSTTTFDRYGIPVATLTGQLHPATLETAEFMRQRALQWLTEAGGENIWSWKPGSYLSGGQHQAGTCRMGDDSKTSVTDEWGRVHGHDNLFVADGSLHVTNGGFNPVLTIMAIAYRVAEGIVNEAR